jgi:hypothetical protein
MVVAFGGSGEAGLARVIGAFFLQLALFRLVPVELIGVFLIAEPGLWRAGYMRRVAVASRGYGLRDGCLA